MIELRQSKEKQYEIRKINIEKACNLIWDKLENKNNTEKHRRCLLLLLPLRFFKNKERLSVFLMNQQTNSAVSYLFGCSSFLLRCYTTQPVLLVWSFYGSSKKNIYRKKYREHERCIKINEMFYKLGIFSRQTYVKWNIRFVKSIAAYIQKATPYTCKSIQMNGHRTHHHFNKSFGRTNRRGNAENIYVCKQNRRVFSRIHAFVYSTFVRLPFVNASRPFWWINIPVAFRCWCACMCIDERKLLKGKEKKNGEYVWGSYAQPIRYLFAIVYRWIGNLPMRRLNTFLFLYLFGIDSSSFFVHHWLKAVCVFEWNTLVFIVAWSIGMNQKEED